MDNDYISSPELSGDSPDSPMEGGDESTTLKSNSGSKSRISGMTAAALITVAALFDAINWIPILNYASSFTQAIVFGFWFWSLGIGWKNPRVFASGAVGLLVSAVPALSALPETIISVAVIIGLVTAEDKLGIKIPTPGNLGGGGGVSTPPPLPGA